jgi:glycosyltransferase involved in cell wall biosynthesis
MAVESALNQTYRNIEVVILDDGSSPPLVDTIDRLYGDCVTLLRFEENRGPYAGRDYAIRRSRGELIAILDDDDLWLPNKTAAQVAALLQSQEVGLICAGTIDVYPGNRRMVRLPVRHRISHNRLLTREWVINSSVLYWRSVYDEVGGYDTSMRRCGDWDFHIRVSRQYSIAALREELLITFMNPGSQQRSSDLTSYESDEWRVIQKHKKELQSRGLWTRTLSHHKYSIGLRYLRAGDFRAAREQLSRSLVCRITLPSLFALAMAHLKIKNDLAIRQIWRAARAARMGRRWSFRHPLAERIGGK